jgi:hypothetical protein
LLENLNSNLSNNTIFSINDSTKFYEICTRVVKSCITIRNKVTQVWNILQIILVTWMKFKEYKSCEEGLYFGQKKSPNLSWQLVINRYLYLIFDQFGMASEILYLILIGRYSGSCNFFKLMYDRPTCNWSKIYAAGYTFKFPVIDRGLKYGSANTGNERTDCREVCFC